MAGSYSSYHSGGGRGDADFSKLAEQIGSNIQKITQNVSSLKKFVSQLGSPQDSDLLRADLHNIQHYTHVLAKDTNDRLKEFNLLPPPASPTDQRMAKIQKERLTNEFTKILNTFQATQREVRQKTEASIHQARSNSTSYGGGKSPFGETRSQKLIELESPVQSQGQLTLQREDEWQLEDLRRQEEAMSQLETDIVAVNEIFRDLATMVHEQGETVDSIEAQIETTHIHVNEGNEQLRQARDHKSSLLRKKFFCGFVIIIILAIVIGIIAWKTSD